MATMESFIEQMTREHMRKYNDAIEAACERMLVSPEPVGVLVEEWPDGAWKVSLSEDETPMEVTKRMRARGE